MPTPSTCTLDFCENAPPTHTICISDSPTVWLLVCEPCTRFFIRAANCTVVEGVPTMEELQEIIAARQTEDAE